MAGEGKREPELHPTGLPGAGPQLRTETACRSIHRVCDPNTMLVVVNECLGSPKPAATAILAVWTRVHEQQSTAEREVN